MSFYWNLFKDAFFAWQDDRAPRMGAALAYYISFSLAPILLIAISIAGVVFGADAARGQIVGQIQGTIGRPGAQTIENMLATQSEPTGNAVMIAVGVVILLLAASGIFGELQDALNTIFKASPAQTSGFWHMVRARFLSFTMVLGVGFMLLVSLVISAVLSALGDFLTPTSMPGGALLWQAINVLVSLALITLLFAMIYRFLPDVHLRWRDVWFGAVVTALFFTLGKTLIGLYLGQASTTSTFGAAGSFVVILIWVYYSSQIMLYGAEVTHLWSVRRGDRPDLETKPVAAETTTEPEKTTAPFPQKPGTTRHEEHIGA